MICEFILVAARSWNDPLCIPPPLLCLPQWAKHLRILHPPVLDAQDFLHFGLTRCRISIPLSKMRGDCYIDSFLLIVT